MSSLRGSRRIAPWLALCTLGALALGCSESDTTPTVQPDPSLSILATQQCGKNLLPVPTAQDLMDQTFKTVTVRVSGTDPATGDQTLIAGTQVVMFIAGEEDGEGGSGRFVSSNEGESESITFAGRDARDQFFCTSRGTVVLGARIDEYQPGGTGEAITVETDRRGFPVECVTQAEWERECGDVIVDFGTLDMGDGGMADGGADGDVDGEADAAEVADWSIRFVPPVAAGDGPLVIGIRGSQRLPDSIQLTFAVLEGDTPLPNIPVTFELPENHPPNVSLSETTVTTNSEGLASTRLNAGGTPGVVTIRATADRDGETETVSSETVVIRGLIPSARSMQFVCEHDEVPAYGSNLRQPALVDGTNCTVQLADRVQGRMEAGVPVFYLTEAGTVTQTVPTDDEGLSTTKHRIGLPPPKDVDPEDYEEAAGYADDVNPRDAWVTLVAVARGEEDFLDTNGNKVYEEGFDVLEPEHDLPEPFIDVDDDGDFDDGDEEFRDANDNGVWDPPNGVWDSDTEIWEQKKVLWTGELPADYNPSISACEGDCSTVLGPGFNPDCPGGASVFTRTGGRFTVTADLRDPWGNCLANRNIGEVSIEVDDGLAVSGDLETQIRDFHCYEPGGPIARPFTWTIEDVVPRPDPMAPPPPPIVMDVTITLSTEYALGNQFQKSWTFSVCH